MALLKVRDFVSAVPRLSNKQQWSVCLMLLDLLTIVRLIGSNIYSRVSSKCRNFQATGQLRVRSTYRVDGQCCYFLVHTSMESYSLFIFQYIHEKKHDSTEEYTEKQLTKISPCLSWQLFCIYCQSIAT